MQPTFTFEIADATLNPFSSAPAYRDCSDLWDSASWSRGRQRQLDACGPGSGTVTVDNSNRDFELGYTGGIFGSNVYLGKRCRLSTVISGVTTRCFTMYIVRPTPAWSAPRDGLVTLELVDAFGLLNRYPITGQFPQAAAGTMTNTVLDKVGWPTADRSILAGGTVIPVTTFTTGQATALPFLQQISDSRPGALFVNGAGQIVQRAADLAVGSAGGTLALGSGGLDFVSGAPVTDMSTMANTVTGSRAVLQNVPNDKPVVQNQQDAASRAEFGPFTGSPPTILAMNDSVVQAVLATYLTNWKWPVETFDPVTIIPVRTSQYTTVLGIEIGTKGTLVRVQDVGANYSQPFVVNSLSHAVSKWESWQTTLRLAARQIH